MKRVTNLTNYDPRFGFDGRHRRPFDHAVVRRELWVIRHDLHCTAVRLLGNGLHQLQFRQSMPPTSALEVWFSPFTCNLDEHKMLTLLADSADRAERIRGRDAAVVFVTGAELSLFHARLLPGDSLAERTGQLLRRGPDMRELVAQLP